MDEQGIQDLVASPPSESEDVYNSSEKVSPAHIGETKKSKRPEHHLKRLARGEPDPWQMEAWRRIRVLNHTYASVCEAMETGLNNVTKAVRRVDNWLRKKFALDIARLRIDHQVKQDEIYREAMDSFFRSKGTHRKRQKRIVKSDEKGHTVERTVSEEDLAGDPRFLKIALDALKSIRDMWGADAADDRAAPNDPDQGVSVNELRVRVNSVIVALRDRERVIGASGGLAIPGGSNAVVTACGDGPAVDLQEAGES